MLTPVEGLREIVSLDQSIQRIVQALPAWEEDALVELYRQSTVLEERSLVVRAAVVAEMVRRRGEGRVPMKTWAHIAGTLGEKVRTVRLLYRIWERILSRLEPTEDLNLPLRLYETAAAAEKYGVDPLEAARYASHMRNVLNPHYTREEFLEDIREGLPDPEKKERKDRPPCYTCPFFATAGEGVQLMLVRLTGTEGEEVQMEILAQSAEGEGTRYCAQFSLMGRSLLEFRTRCPVKEEACTPKEGGSS